MLYNMYLFCQKRQPQTNIQYKGKKTATYEKEQIRKKNNKQQNGDIAK